MTDVSTGFVSEAISRVYLIFILEILRISKQIQLVMLIYQSLCINLSPVAISRWYKIDFQDLCWLFIKGLGNILDNYESIYVYVIGRWPFQVAALSDIKFILDFIVKMMDYMQ